MIYKDDIVGRYVTLRSATEKDAEFTLMIRQDAEIEKYLPRLDNTVEQQREWIKIQQKKQNDYFFVVFDKEDHPIGTYGFCDVEVNEKAESGRLAMKGNAMQNFETQLLAYKFAFSELRLKYVYGFIFESNKRNQRFNISFGAEIEEPSIEMYGTKVVKCICKKENFIEATKNLEKFLYR